MIEPESQPTGGAGAAEAIPGAPLYEVRNVSKAYGSVAALVDVDMCLRAGEVVGLVGDNGAGKSTLVKVLSGAHLPDAGRLFFEGVEQEWRSPHEPLAAGIETLYQDSGLAPDLTISANIFLGRELLLAGLLGRFYLRDDREMAIRATKSLAGLGIAVPDPSVRVSQLSGGQRQAVAIGRAVAWARKVIILDEPTNHLGARQAFEVLQAIRHAKQGGLGIIMVSHTLPHIFDVADRIVVLRLGRVVADARASDFTADSLVKVITGLD